MNIPFPNLTSGLPVEQHAREQLSLPGGTLSFSVPVISLPQRGGGSLDIGFLFSGASQALRETGAQFQPYSRSTSTTEALMTQVSASIEMVQPIPHPWQSPLHPNLPTLGADLSYLGYVSENVGGDSREFANTPEYCVQNWTFTDWNGGTHSFNGARDCTYTYPNTATFDNYDPLETQTSDSVDDAFYTLDARNKADLRVIGRDGMVYHFTSYTAPYQSQQANPQSASGDRTNLGYYGAVFSSMVDPNGNTVSVAAANSGYTLTDTVGRKVVVAGNSITYDTTVDGVLHSVASEIHGVGISGQVPWPYTNQTPCAFSNPPPPYSPARNVVYTGSGSGAYPATTTTSISLPDGSQYFLTFDTLGDLIKVQYPTGGYTRYDYYPGTAQVDFGDVRCAAPSIAILAKHECAQANGSCTQTPSSSTDNSCTPGTPIGGESTTCYSGLFGPPITTSSLDVRDPRGDRTHYEFFTGQIIPGDPPSIIGSLELARVYYAGESVPLRTIQNNYAAAPGCIFTGWASHPCKVISTLNDVSPALTSVVVNQYESAPPYNLTQVDEQDFSGNIVRTTTTQWERAGIYTDLAPTPGSVGHILDGIQSSTVSETATRKSVVITHTYDAVGNRIQSDSAATNAANSSSRISRNSSGDITEFHDPMQFAGNHVGSTVTGYAAPAIPGCPQNVGPGLPTTITNAFGQITTVAYDAVGRKACIEDANGQITRLSHDTLGRTTEIDYPDDGKKTASYTFAAPLTATETVYQDAHYSPSQQTVLDGFGRTSQHILLSPGEGTTCTETFYDSVGHVSGVNDPRIGCLGSVAPNASVQFLYDALGRKTKQINEDGTFAHWVYSGVTTDLFDEASNHSQNTTDAFGRAVIVLEPNASNSPSLQTAYQYDGFGNLQSVTQTGTSGESSRGRAFTYDGLSRLLTSANPETGSICYGTWSGGSPGAGSCQSGYDLNGNLLAKTDGRGITTFAYDGLNRLVAKSYTDGTPSACLRYDVGAGGTSVANGIGRVSVDWTQPGTCSQQGDVPVSTVSWKKIGSYDQMGRITAESQCPFAPCTATPSGRPANPVQYAYDFAGDLALSTNGMPSSGSPGIIVNYGRDSGGRMASVNSSWDQSPAFPATLFKADALNDYGPFGLLRAQLAVDASTQRAAMTHTRTYDGRTRLASMSTSGNSSSSVPNSPVSLTVTPLQLPAGVRLFWSATCDATCGTGGGNILLDGVLDGGFTYLPNIVSESYIAIPPTIAQHTLQILYLGDATHPAQSSKVVTFNVVPNTVPAPSLTITLDPSPIPQGESANILVAATCGSQCADANIMVDGVYAGGLIFDENGQSGSGTDSNLSLGQHTMMVDYFGNATSSNTQKTVTFNVVAASLPNPTIQITPVAPQPIPSDEYGSFTANFSCGANCRGGQYFIDGNFSGGYYPDSTGTAPINTSPGLSVGHHSLTINYPGDTAFAVYTTPPFDFSVVADTLPVPVVTATPNPNPVPANQSNPLAITVLASVQNCGGTGHLFVDGVYSGFFFPDANGNAPASTLPMAAGSHQLTVSYYGTGTCAPKTQTFTLQAQ